MEHKWSIFFTLIKQLLFIDCPESGPGPPGPGSGPVRGWTGPDFVGSGPGGDWTGPWGRTQVGPGPDLNFSINK